MSPGELYAAYSLQRKKEDTLVEMFTTMATFTTSCLANSTFPSPGGGQFMSSTYTEHKAINLGGVEL